MKKYEITVFPSCWQIKNKETNEIIMEEPVPYEPSNLLETFFKKVFECKSDEEVFETYENTVRKWSE